MLLTSAVICPAQHCGSPFAAALRASASPPFAVLLWPGYVPNNNFGVNVCQLLGYFREDPKSAERRAPGGAQQLQAGGATVEATRLIGGKVCVSADSHLLPCTHRLA
jgi:hypothetical protein